MSRTLTPGDLDSVIAKYTHVAFDDATPLLRVDLDSLTLLRIAVDVVADRECEIDASGLVRLKTVKDLKDWLVTVSVASATAAGGDPEAAC